MTPSADSALLMTAPQKGDTAADQSSTLTSCMEVMVGALLGSIRQTRAPQPLSTAVRDGCYLQTLCFEEPLVVRH